MNANQAVERACKALDTQAELARRLGVTPPMVQQWKTGLRPVPAQYCPAIERVTKGKVTRKDLRPDDWHLIWPELIGPDGAPELANHTEEA
ncbi:transcriptional regulator [Aquabacterium sp.]|uniref:transcriptional regulator n=1 Tax=Aquabacterium sp. TaxID=1872578 RepID=UPI0035B4EBB2